MDNVKFCANIVTSRPLIVVVCATVALYLPIVRFVIPVVNADVPIKIVLVCPVPVAAEPILIVFDRVLVPIFKPPVANDPPTFKIPVVCDVPMFCVAVALPVNCNDPVAVNRVVMTGLSANAIALPAPLVLYDDDHAAPVEYTIPSGGKTKPGNGAHAII